LNGTQKKKKSKKDGLKVDAAWQVIWARTSVRNCYILWHTKKKQIPWIQKLSSCQSSCVLVSFKYHPLDGYDVFVIYIFLR
jgi:hypothetical protein